MEQDPFIGRYYVGRRYLRECRLYRVLGSFTPPGYGMRLHYRCDTLEYSGDNTVSIEHHLIDANEAGDIFTQEINEAQYQLGIDLFYKSLVQIRQCITSLKGISCDLIQVGKAYRLLDRLYFNVQRDYKEDFIESQCLEINPSSISIRRTCIASSLTETNFIGYEEIGPNDAQKAIKQFELFHATISNYINSLVKEDPPYSFFDNGKS